MTFERIIETDARRYAGAHAAERWQFIATERGVFVRPYIDENRLSRDEHAAMVAALQDQPPHFEDTGDDGRSPLFPNIQYAKRYAQLADEEESVAAEMSAFHAPSECGDIAYRRIERERAALLQYAIHN